jgi:ribonuclease HI
MERRSCRNKRVYAMTTVKRVKLFTDGACSGNPGPGGYGVILQYGDHRRELSGGFRRTTNNRMELTAAIRGLEALNQRCKVTMTCDSEYVINAITRGWARTWRQRGWRREGKVVPNWDLWTRLLDLLQQQDVTLEWVRGHAGHDENEHCDQLARAAISRAELAIDDGFENPKPPPVVDLADSRSFRG